MHQGAEEQEQLRPSQALPQALSLADREWDESDDQGVSFILS